jgi:hypothetical protein
MKASAVQRGACIYLAAAGMLLPVMRLSVLMRLNMSGQTMSW